MAHQKNTLHAISSRGQWTIGVLQQVNIEHHEEEARDAKGLWLELLPKVLWAYRTMPKACTRETPYSLVYGTDAIILVEVGEPGLKYSHESGLTNDERMRQDLDVVKEQRDMSYIRMVAQKQQAERYYNKKAKIR
ncbi:uncharacterized protein [Nicotiana sylvestris]|uniref:Uncharacterized protein LOC104211366 n=1 Tax=Nicotiana sylvestris TaxID=4096 RepID=A0A1U7V158_NICSY|nr:PREDICTED: uncharacterized protein LOC104211366 [Nicotiana sylvestris]